MNRNARKFFYLFCIAATYSIDRGKLYEYKLPSEWQWYRQEHDDKIFRERKAKQTFQAGLQYLPFFLAEAAPLPELAAYLKTNQLDPIRAKELPREAWAVDKAKVEEEVAAYLEVRSVMGTFSPA